MNRCLYLSILKPREQMFLERISLLIAAFLFRISHVFVINASYNRSQSTSLHCTTYQYVECLLLLLLFMSHVELLVHGYAILGEGSVRGRLTCEDGSCVMTQ